jgi:hypothetical protein
MTTSIRGRRAAFLSCLAIVFLVSLELGAAARVEAGLIVIGTPAGGTGGNPPSNIEGGGNLIKIFKQAAAYWQAAFPDPAQRWTLNIVYGWAGNDQLDGGSAAAYFRLESAGGDPNRILSGRVVFDNSGSTLWFADPNPASNAAYSTVTPLGGEVSVPNAPGGIAWLNTGIHYTDPRNEAAVGRLDLLTIAMHEIGHGLGLLQDPPIWAPPGQEFPVSDYVSQFYAGYEIFLESGLEHLPEPSVIPLIPEPGIRAFPAAQDIMVMAELSHYRRPVLDPYFEMIIGDLDIPNKVGLIAQIRIARLLAQAGNRSAASSILESFIRQVGANPGGRLSPEQVEGLVGMAQAAIGAL